MSATPESIALASTIVVQCKGDLSQARRSVAEALAWLQTVDPSHKPDPKPAAEDPRVAQLQTDLAVAQAAASKLRDDLTDWQDRALTAESKRDAYKAELDGFKLRAAIASDSASKPQPAPVRPTPAAPAPAAAPTPTLAAVDPYAGLPPKMRAFLAAQAGKGLEID